MIEFALQVLNLVWKVLIIYAIIALGRALTRNGRGTIRDIFDTIVMWINFITRNAQQKMVAKMRAASEQQKTKES